MLTLSEILRTRLIPWSEEKARERFIVAGPQMRQADMPYGVQLIPHKIQSKRMITKRERCYNNVRNIIAEWPEAGLQELGKYLLVCVLDGYINYQVGNYRLQCGPGHFIFVPPGMPHPNGSKAYVDLQKSTFCDITTFVLHPNALECWSSHCTAQGRKRSNNCLFLYERAVFLLEALVEEVIGGENYSLQIGGGLLNGFFTLLLRELEAGRVQFTRRGSAEKEAFDMPGTDFRKRLERYIQDNFRKPLTLDAMAAEMYFSSAQFTRVMRRETGKSFHEYLTEYRMEEAKRLLQNSHWTITVIASFVGFKSPDYFRTFFKRYVGVTPGEFRTRESKEK